MKISILILAIALTACADSAEILWNYGGATVNSSSSTWWTLDRDDTIQEGDQWFDKEKSTWIFTKQPGRSLKSKGESESEYRRWREYPTSPGINCSFVSADEKIREGDEFFHDGKWIPSQFAGAFAGKANYYRRSNPDSKGYSMDVNPVSATNLIIRTDFKGTIQIGTNFYRLKQAETFSLIKAN